jgi:hypothetical protein
MRSSDTATGARVRRKPQRRGLVSIGVSKYLLAGVCAVPNGITAQICKRVTPDDSLTTDRPSSTNASTVVPCRGLQIESGLQESSEQGHRGFDVPEANLRFGVLTKTEFRVSLPNYYQSYTGSTGVETGIGDLGIGVKQALHEGKAFNAAALASVSLPTGATAVSSHAYVATVQFLPSEKLSANWMVAGSLGVSWATQAARRNVTGQATTLLDRTINKHSDAFLEYQGIFPQRGRPQHTLDFGASYRPTGRQQVDLRAGFGVSAVATDHFLGIGYSVRFSLPPN